MGKIAIRRNKQRCLCVAAMAKRVLATVLVLAAVAAAFPKLPMGENVFFSSENIVTEGMPTEQDQGDVQVSAFTKDITDALDITRPPEHDLLHPMQSLAEEQGKPEWEPDHHRHRHYVPSASGHKKQSRDDNDDDEEDNGVHFGDEYQHHHTPTHKDEFPLGRCVHQCMSMPVAEDANGKLGEPSSSACEKSCEEGMWNSF